MIFILVHILTLCTCWVRVCSDTYRVSAALWDRGDWQDPRNGLSGTAGKYNDQFHSTIINPRCTSIKIIKNEVGCRDDTVPTTVDTRRQCEEE